MNAIFETENLMEIFIGQFYQNALRFIFIKFEVFKAD